MAMTSQASAPAKIILVGEHAVVYGQPAIALPLPQVRAYAEYHACDQALTVVAENNRQRLFCWSKEDECPHAPIAAMIRLTAQFFGLSDLRGEILLRSDIPIASGLGSGAAVSAALGRAVAALLNRELSDGALNELVYEIEKLHHGRPSGIDNTVVVYEKPVYYVKGKSLEFIDVPASLQLAVADSGIAALTRDTVADVRAQYLRQPQPTRSLLENIGRLAKQARIEVETGQIRQLGKLMTENHELLRRLNVSSPPLDRLVEAAIEAGAYGAKLSGGGRGGTVIALVDDRRLPAVKAALTAADAKNVVTSSVAGQSASL